MSRNNSDRLGLDDNTTPDGGADAPITAVDGGSQGLSFSMPTEHVELPSGGRYYHENHPLHNQETIEIKYMTAKEEDILTSPSLVKKGLTVERLLRSIIIDKTIDPQHLLIGDRNAIIIASRVTGYGPEYRAQTTCPACMTQDNWEVDLSNLNINPGGVVSANGYEVTEGENNGEYNIVVPKTKVTVTVKLLTGRDELSIAQRTKKRKKHTQEETNLVTQMKSMIVAVNGSRKESDIDRLIEFLPALDSRYIRNAYSNINPNLDMKYPFECQNCDHEDTLEVPLTAEFFWPKGGTR